MPLCAILQILFVCSRPAKAAGGKFWVDVPSNAVLVEREGQGVASLPSFCFNSPKTLIANHPRPRAPGRARLLFCNP
jgi:hypothetical protein